LSSRSKGTRIFLVSVILLGAAASIFHYWLWIGRAPSVTADEAART
jgi:hypothetical protein